MKTDGSFTIKAYAHKNMWGLGGGGGGGERERGRDGWNYNKAYRRERITISLS